MNPDKNNNHIKKPPLPFGLGPIARNYATLNKLMSGDSTLPSYPTSTLTSSSSIGSRSSQLEVPSAATTFYSSPYSSSSTASMPYGTMSSSSNRKLNTKSSSPILFRRTEKHNDKILDTALNSEHLSFSDKFRVKKETLEKKSSLPISSAELFPLSLASRISKDSSYACFFCSSSIDF